VLALNNVRKTFLRYSLNENIINQPYKKVIKTRGIASHLAIEGDLACQACNCWLWCKTGRLWPTACRFVQ